eukprot:EG_transcript_5998
MASRAIAVLTLLAGVSLAALGTSAAVPGSHPAALFHRGPSSTSVDWPSPALSTIRRRPSLQVLPTAGISIPTPESTHTVAAAVRPGKAPAPAHADPPPLQWALGTLGAAAALGASQAAPMSPAAVILAILSTTSLAILLRRTRRRRSEPPIVATPTSDDVLGRYATLAAQWLACSLPAALFLFLDWGSWNARIPPSLPLLQVQYIMPLTLLALLWHFRAVHWVGARVAMWMYEQRISLLVERRPRRIILLRHGESIGNLDKDVYETVPDNRLWLSDQGHDQALEAGAKIKQLIGGASVGIFVSPFLRTQQTCAIILSKLDPKQVMWVRQDPRLREQEWGNFQITRDSSKILQERDSVGRFYYRFPTGESGADVYDRVSSFFVSLFRQFDGPARPPENIVIVSHGLMMRFFCMRYFRWAVDTFDTVWNPDNCELWVLVKDDRGRYSFNNQGAIPRSTKPVTIVFKSGKVETMTIKDYITAPVAERRREDWILAQLGLNPDDVERVVLDRNLELCAKAESVEDEEYPMSKLLDAEERIDEIPLRC